MYSSEAGRCGVMRNSSGRMAALAADIFSGAMRRDCLSTPC